MGGFEMNYVPLNIKTEYSLLSSLIKVKDLVLFAKQNNIKALTITDPNLYGAMEFYHECLKENIKPIIGLEVLLEQKILIFYAENKEGYQSLIKLSTIQSERSITKKDLETYHEGLLAIVPYDSYEFYDFLIKLYPHVFCSYQSKEERSSYTNEPLVYMNEIRYLKKEQDKYLKILYDIRDGKTVQDSDLLPSGKELKLPSDFELDDLKNNQQINSLCQFELPKEKDLLPVYNCPDSMDSYTYLKHLCITGLKEKFGSSVSVKYRDRLKYELDIIHKMGFCNYFLIVWDYVKYAKTHDILVGPGRGSAAGSLVSYLLDITTIDPLQYDLLFERFLNPERISMPDIDIDFQDIKRDEVTKYCISKYGMKRVAGIITFSTLKSKQVIRDVARVLELSGVEQITSLLDAKMSLMENYNQNEKLKQLLNSDSQYRKLYQISLALEGLKRQTSIHAAGIVMCRKDLDEVIPLSKASSDFYTTGYSMEYLEELGLLKMDFLALRNLTLIEEVITGIQKDGIAITFDTIPDHDQKTYEIFETVNTEGIFQFESSGMKNFLRKFKPNNFEELAAAIALFRPGPMNNIDTFIARKRNKEEIRYLDPSLEPILKPTYGIMIYQEQIMQVASQMAGYNLAEADLLRKAMSKKKEDILIGEKEKFIRQSIDRGYSKEVAEETYAAILKFASYGFNRAHSVAYAKIAYRMAYLKAHYPSYFMGALLSMVIGSSVKTKEYIYEAKLNHIPILKPDINFSTNHYQMEQGGIRFPLANIKNVGESAVRLILEERKKAPFQDLYDFVSRTYGRGVNKKTLESLIDAGCFDCFHINKRTMHKNLDLIINYGEITKDVGTEFVDKPELEREDEFSKYELMAKELDIFGFYLSNHPITEYKLKKKEYVPLANIDRYFDKVMKTVVYVDKIKTIDTKKGEKMGFFTGSDELTNVDIVLFPKAYEKYKEVQVGDIIELTAKVEKRFDKMQLVVRMITILESSKKSFPK